MLPVKVFSAIFIILMMIVLGAKEADADCLSGRFRGGCVVWRKKRCEDLCRQEGRRGGHCSPSLKCWCEGC
ncbi:drosomycin-like [Drosophila eugracilis]|uniref:drosomycin-like n=1 Tax=Drosophila eugracilis TaxID=29029 RepID=UPI0007E79375|nr:drosomycin-like [Drosophila eugracilis]